MAEAPREGGAREPDGIEFTGHQHGPRLAVVVSLIAVAWSLFQMWIASPLPFLLGFGIIVDVPARGIHLAFALLLCYLTFPAARRLASDRIPWYDLILAFLACGAALYLFLGYGSLVRRQGVLLDIDLFGFEFPFEAVLGGIGIVLLLEGTRRAIGLPLVIVAPYFWPIPSSGNRCPTSFPTRGSRSNG